MGSWPRSSALDHYRCASEPAIVEGHGVLVRELPHCGKLLLQARASSADISKALLAIIGFDLPTAGHATGNASLTALWLGPQKWLLLTDADRSTGLREQLEAALSGMPSLLADVSDARVGIEVAGQNARNLLSKVCAPDLSNTSFGPEQCAQSQLARIPLLIYQIDASPSFHLFVDRSLADYAWEWLIDAAHEFRKPPQP